VFDDEVQYPSPYGASTHAKVAASEVLEILEAEGGAELRDLMFSTCALDETVADYVARVHARKARRVDGPVGVERPSGACRNPPISAHCQPLQQGCNAVQFAPWAGPTPLQVPAALDEKVTVESQIRETEARKAVCPCRTPS
jgi:hypothetical protein